MSDLNGTERDGVMGLIYRKRKGRGDFTNNE